MHLYYRFKLVKPHTLISIVDREILSDCGAYLMSVVFKKLWELREVRHIKTLHQSETNGVDKRFNGTLKSILSICVTT